MRKIYDLTVFSRSLILWIAFSALLWTIFTIGVFTHPDAWTGTLVVEQKLGWGEFAFILRNNGIILALIVVGNLFVRFGTVTPGLLILTLQAIMIGWTAGTNQFSEPFPSVAEANAAFLRIGLWETTAYVLICAVTLPKSHYIAEHFPAREWSEIRSWKGLALDRAEFMVTAFSVLALLFAASAEAFFPR